jgi:large subunit ribosomal protein L27e
LLIFSIKSGKVVIVLSGRFAGRKAVVVKARDEGNATKKFGHALGNYNISRWIPSVFLRLLVTFYLCCFCHHLVAGIDRYPRKVVRAMGKAKLDKKIKIKPFVKVLNFNHVMPTRYSLDLDLKKIVDETSVESANIVNTRKSVKKVFEEKYKSQSAKSDKKTAGVAYFFNKLRF